MSGEKYVGDKRPDGMIVGRSATDLVGFHGKTPTSQRASATLSSDLSCFAMTGASLVSAQTLSAGLATLFDAVTEIRATLVAYGLHKGAT